MSLLTEQKMPTALVVDGVEYEIHSDFRTWIKLTQEFFLQEITSMSIAKALCAVYKEIPPNPEQAITAMFEFYTGANQRQQKNGKKTRERRMVFDFDVDSALIFSSFFEQYHIDLSKETLHWWTFRSLFDNLSPSTPFGKALHFRSIDIGKIKDNEQRKYYLQMKRLYELPDNRSEEEKEESFAETLASIF